MASAKSPPTRWTSWPTSAKTTARPQSWHMGMRSSWAMRAFSSNCRKISLPLGDSSAVSPPGQGGQQVGPGLIIGCNGRGFHRLGDLRHLDLSHRCSLLPHGDGKGRSNQASLASTGMIWAGRELVVYAGLAGMIAARRDDFAAKLLA